MSAEFSDLVREWPDDNLQSALTAYADDYGPAQLQAIRAEAARRGLAEGPHPAEDCEPRPGSGATLLAALEEASPVYHDGRVRRGWVLAGWGLAYLLALFPLALVLTENRVLSMTFLGCGAVLAVLGKAERRQGFLRGSDGAARVLLLASVGVAASALLLYALGLLPRR